ncbi:mannitol dehydrogenase family protein [Paraglaciecola sp.]|uniref:mannitol dehydrogenase family protein n=1 Tax=Paraglaciecola sp. TaxID=1920173 RepID=UPI00273F33B8|nr:mannitol dehydrogenase family protein [Paraglaciecola sp.]MDP5033283.1 mannitol dehydrogenase family protein [Paraglaciecola sp.]
MSASRLNLALLEKQQISTYRQAEKPISIVHLGIGAFHRAHQAWYTDKVNLLQENEPWYIAGVSLRSSNVQKQLQPQDGLYNVVEFDADFQHTQLVQAVTQVLVAPDSPERVLELMAQEHTKIISLTVTEKGYCHDPATGRLNLDHPDIKHDLANANAPKSAIGYLVFSLQRRFKVAATGVTVLCCDNLPQNGHTLAGLVGEFAKRIDPALASWIVDNVSFPNSMVDRIVPATTEEDIQQHAQTGQEDRGLVKTERFSQWVIEDNFIVGRPAWEQVGVSLVCAVEPFEKAKLRLLNGAHSALAYLGYLNGYQFVHQVMQDKSFVVFLRHMMRNEILPTLVAPEGMILEDYIEQLLTRFTNPNLHHRTYQIAMDGSQKLPQRLLNTIEDRLNNNASFDCLCFAVAGWLRYSMAFDGKGEPIEVQDPYARELFAIQQAHFYQIDDLIDNYLSFDKVFSRQLAQSELFCSRLKYWLGIILANGINTALKVLLIEVK